MRTSLRCLFAISVLLAVAPIAYGGDIRVGFINPNGPPEFWNLIIATMQAAAPELGIDLDVRTSDNSHDKTIALTREILDARPRIDYLLASNNLETGGEIIKLADAAGVPLILLNSDLLDKDREVYGLPRAKYPRWLGSITPDHESGGYGIAEAILTKAAQSKRARPIKLLALSGDAANSASVERVTGMQRAVAALKERLGPGSVEVVGVRYLDWSAKTAEDSMGEFLRSGQRVDALWAANDPMALGALKAVRDAGLKPGRDVYIGGLNWSQEAVDRVLDGQMVVTHGGHFLLGAWAMVVVRDYHDGRDFAEENVRLKFPMGAIDLRLARRFPTIGKVDWRKVDFTRFSKTRNPTVRRYAFTPDAVLRLLPSEH